VADERSLKVLLESIAEVSSSFALDHVLEAIVDKSLQITEAERALLFLGNDPDDLSVRVARARGGDELPGDQVYSTSVVRRCLTDVEAIRSVVQSDREALELGQSVFDLKLRAVMCAPLLVKRKIIGAIYVDSKGARREFTARDLALFGALSQQLAIAVENARLLADSLEKIRLEKDLQIAKRIQGHLLAPVPEKAEGLDLALFYSPVAAASGDTYDFVALGSSRHALAIGDVTGHGVGAALVTHAAQAAMRSYLELVDDPGRS
jgi:phosphoserine phosphatase